MNNYKKPETIDATPSKGIYRSIIADYDLTTAICELIDNALDARKTTFCEDELKVYLHIDTHHQKITIKDNACGIKREELKKLISPGETSSTEINGLIGIFGVGSKRAVVALSQKISVTTRFNEDKTYCLTYDDDWLKSDDWELPYFEVEDIEKNTTKIELSELRFFIEDDDLKALRIELATIYAYFIKDNEIQIYLNNELVGTKFFDQWAYPPNFEPTQFTQRLRNDSFTKEILFELTSGLTYEKGSISGDYGVFIYCNKRLIARALKSPEVGFDSAPHPSLSIARVIVHLTSSPELMPWTSSKRAISYNHDTFRLIRGNLISVMKNAIALSKALKPDSDIKVEPFKTGNIKQEVLGMKEIIKPSKLPQIPKTRSTYKDNILTLNKMLGAVKPWTKTLYESIIAEEYISKQSVFTQKHTLSVILLDGVVEIGCKEFLKQNKINDIDNKLISKLGRLRIFNEVEKYILSGDNIWMRFQKIYEKRISLSSQEFNGRFSDSEITQLREDVKTFLSAAFEIKFPQ